MSRSQIRSQNSNSSSQRKRSPNLTDIEDVALCRAFISIGEDETIGNEQKYAAMWRRIEEAYYILLPNAYRRPLNTLQHRCAKINAAVQIFTGILAHYEHAKAIGNTDIDVMNEANKEYRQEVLKKWMFHEFYEILNDFPKWSLASIRLNNMHNLVEVPGEGSTSSPCTLVTRREHLNMNDNYVDLEPSIPRLLGRKQKLNEKRKNVDPELEKLELGRKERLAKANENFEAFIGIKQRELEFKEKEIELKNLERANRARDRFAMRMEEKAQEEEDRLNFMDTSRFTDSQLAYHQSRMYALAQARIARNNIARE